VTIRATESQVKAFIAKIAPIAQKLQKTRQKWILPSVCIAQACCESAYGTSKAMAAANGLFGFKVGKGVKYGDGWNGTSYSTKTKEYYDQYVTITDNFRSYETVENAVIDYMDLLTSLSRYKAAVNNPDALSTITAIKNGGYATSPTYINTIMTIINKYDLTQYDGTSPVSTYPILRLNSRGATVTMLQQRLTSAGYGVGKIDGIFGVKTFEAVKAYQAEHGLVVDGVVGAKTWRSLIG
jgi:flagellum-specific peptidoglycan hydrolase FlgJ